MVKETQMIGLIKKMKKKPRIVLAGVCFLGFLGFIGYLKTSGGGFSFFKDGFDVVNLSMAGFLFSRADIADAKTGGKSPVSTATIPPIDLAAPVKTETATFAMG